MARLLIRRSRVLTIQNLVNKRNVGSGNQAAGLAADGGERSRGLVKVKGRDQYGELLPTIGRTKREVLSDAEITVQDANRGERAATIEEGVFEQYAAKKKAQGEPVYVQQAIKDMTGKKP